MTDHPGRPDIDRDGRAVPTMASLATPRLRLDPLVVADADAMFAVLREPALHRYLDAPPPASVDALRVRYRRLEARASPDGLQGWLNWIVRTTNDDAPIGFVQATTMADRSAWIAYLIGAAHQGRGLATEATAAMIAHLGSDRGIRRCVATVETDNVASIRLLIRLAFRAATVTEAAGHSLTPDERLFLRDDAPAAAGCGARAATATIGVPSSSRPVAPIDP